MLSIYHFYTFATALLTTNLLVPIVAILSVKFGNLDIPDERKIHSNAIPRLGGIAIFSGLLLTIILFFTVDATIKGLLAGAIVIFLTGLADDLINLSARQKFAGEFLAAGVAVFAGNIYLQDLGDPFGLGVIELGILAIPFTIIALVGVMNAVNLMDGLDGLAGSICAIASVAFAIISFRVGNEILFSLSIVLLGVLLGFLRHNTYPATIFMGDCGSLLLGYCMGVSSILLVTMNGVHVSPFIPLIILGLPILDTLAVMTNRYRAGKKIFSPDMNHLHHRLLDLGFGHKYSVLCAVGISYMLSLIAVVGHNYSDKTLLIFLILLSAGIYFLLHWVSANGRVTYLNLNSNLPVLTTDRYRLIVSFTGYLSIICKYLLLFILLLPIVIVQDKICGIGLAAILLLLLGGYVMLQRQPWSNQILQIFIYTSGCLLLFMTENYGRHILVFDIQLTTISNILFALLLISAAGKIFLRNRSGHLLVSSFEYLIVFIVICMPLLPPQFTGQFHLLAVAAKSVILFVGFKLILMRQMKRNRKIILVITLSLLIIAIRFLMACLP